MSQPIFSYGLTRYYPYRPWFTWLVMVGGVIAIALFSALNVVANGYEVVTEYITDVNQTENPIAPAWYQKRPWSLASRVNIFCQDQVFEIGSQIYTNNTNLKYEIVNLAVMNQTQQIQRISFTYHNDILRDCILQELTMQRRRSQSYGNLEAIVNCTTYDSSYRMPIIMTMVYTYTVVASSSNSFTDINWLTISARNPNPFAKAQGDDSTYFRTQVAAWWGALLLRDYFGSGCLPLALPIDFLLLDKSNFSDTRFLSTFFQGGRYANVIESESYSNPLSQSFASANVNSRTEKTFTSIETWTSTFGNDTLDFYTCTDRPCAMLGGTDPIRLITLYWDSVAKIFYSFMLSDLGQRVQFNILGNKSAFVDFLNATKNSVDAYIYKSSACSLQNAFKDSDVRGAKQDYPFNDTDASKFYEWYGSASPTVNPAVISTQYLCQIPKRKPIGTIIVNTIVADFVFIQVLWMIFSFVVRFLLERRDPQANYCAGCTKMMEGDPPNEDAVSVPLQDHEIHERSSRYSLVTTLENPAIRKPQVGDPPQTGTVDDNGFQTLSLLSGGESVHTPPPHAY